MKIKSMLDNWEKSSKKHRVTVDLSSKIPTTVAAKIQALTELFPGQTRDKIIADLLNASLEELEQGLPYIKGEEVVSEDELGDPIYNDAGLTPTFHKLTQKHLDNIEGANPA